MSDKVKISEKDNKIRIPYATIISFIISLFLCSILIFITIKNKSDIETMTMERLIVEKSIQITNVISKLLYKTQTLSALVLHDDGKIENFERIATTVMDDPAILNLILAPSGIVSNVYPLEGNEGVVGFNLLGEGAGNKEAIMAKEKKQLVFGGPFELVQGGQALVGRLPIWINTADGDRRFWGLVSVTLKYPEVLYGAGLDALNKQDLAYEIWRINPDDGAKQTIASGRHRYVEGTPYVEEPINILNANWYFRIFPVRQWYEHSENWVLVVTGLFISMLIAFIVRSNYDLKSVKGILENMVCTDPLTGLLNRKGLFYELDELIGKNKNFILYYIDLNYFKEINDTYGHNIGDYVLRQFSEKVKIHIDKTKILSRISGDEFILVETDTSSPDEEDVFWNKVIRDFDTPIPLKDKESILLTFSKGKAVFPENGTTVDELISYADKGMYQEKRDKYSAERRRRSTDTQQVGPDE